MTNTRDLNSLLDDLIAVAQDLVLMEDVASDVAIAETETELLIIKNEIMELCRDR